MRKKRLHLLILMLLPALIGFCQNGNFITIEIGEENQMYEAMIVQKFNSARKGKSYQTVDSLETVLKPLHE